MPKLEPAREVTWRGPTVAGSVDNFIENLSLLVDGISRVFGRNCEVVLHDLRQPEHSIVAIPNGHVTGRRVGDPLIGGPIGDIGLRLLQDGAIPSVLGTYATHVRDGRTLKGGVEQAALALGVSRFTIYNYLNELRYRTTD